MPEGDGAKAAALHSTPSTRLQRRLQLLGLTLLVPWMVLFWVLAHILAWLITFNIWPSYCLAKRLYWACPFIPHIWSGVGGVRGQSMRIGFEASYCINFFTRLLTLPIRRQLPDFYIVGFPKCGTTSLAEHLKRHPAISGTAGLPYHETLSKETHFFAGALGRACAHSGLLYRSFFPTLINKWWAEAVKGVEKWKCFDACPVHACLPHVAARIAALTPQAKIIVMLRNPVAGVFSAETMFRELGVPLPWKSLAEGTPEAEAAAGQLPFPANDAALAVEAGPFRLSLHESTSTSAPTPTPAPALTPVPTEAEAEAESKIGGAEAAAAGSCPPPQPMNHDQVNPAPPCAPCCPPLETGPSQGPPLWDFTHTKQASKCDAVPGVSAGAPDPRFRAPLEVVETWRELTELGPKEDLPYRMPQDLYFSLYSHMQCGKYAELLRPYLQHFPAENIMIINFDEFTSNTEAMVRKTMDFIGVETHRFQYTELPPGMKGNYRGRKMHASVKSFLTEYYRCSVADLYQLLGRDLGWEGFGGLYPGGNSSSSGSDGSSSILRNFRSAGKMSEAFGQEPRSGALTEAAEVQLAASPAPAAAAAAAIQPQGQVQYDCPVPPCGWNQVELGVIPEPVQQEGDKKPQLLRPRHDTAMSGITVPTRVLAGRRDGMQPLAMDANEEKVVLRVARSPSLGDGLSPRNMHAYRQLSGRPSAVSEYHNYGHIPSLDVENGHWMMFQGQDAQETMH